MSPKLDETIKKLKTRVEELEKIEAEYKKVQILQKHLDDGAVMFLPVVDDQERHAFRPIVGDEYGEDPKGNFYTYKSEFPTLYSYRVFRRLPKP